MNTAVLASYDPMQGDDSYRNSSLKIAESVFAIVFLLEAMIKIIGLTFYSKHTETSYIRKYASPSTASTPKPPTSESMPHLLQQAHRNLLHPKVCLTFYSKLTM